MTLENIIAQVCDINSEEVSLESSPNNIIEWDSMKHIEIILMCEAEFNVSFTASEIPLLTSVSKIKAVIDNKLS